MLPREKIKEIIKSHGKYLRPRWYQMLNDLYQLQQLGGLYKHLRRENKPIDVVECGCSWGQNAYVELTKSTTNENYFPIKSWVGYECDQTNCDIIDEVFELMVEQGYKGTIPEFIHSAVSGSRAKTVQMLPSEKNAVDNHTIEAPVMTDVLLDHMTRITSRHKTPADNHVPNTHYKKLPKCDLLIVDIEGTESQIDFSKIDAHYYHVETHHPEYTKKLRSQIASGQIFKLLDLWLCHKHDKHLRKPGTSDSIVSFKRISRDPPRQLFRNRVTRN